MAEKDRIRVHKLQVNLSDLEYERLKQLSVETDLPYSNIVRSFINFGKIDAFWLDEDSRHLIDQLNENFESFYRELIYEIGKIGTNLNQVAYNTNVNLEAGLSDINHAFTHVVTLEQTMIEHLEILKKLVVEFELESKVTKKNADYTHS